MALELQIQTLRAKSGLKAVLSNVSKAGSHLQKEISTFFDASEECSNANASLVTAPNDLGASNFQN